MKKAITILFFFSFILISSAQELDAYKYIIIPETYEFTGETDKYRLNSLTKYLFEQNGFNTLMNSENMPKDIQNDRCLGLKTKLENNSSLFVTKLTFKLIDCNDNVIYTSKEGRSREKQFQSAYQEALRDAFTSFQEMNYNYTPLAPVVAEVEKEVVPAPAEKPEKEEKPKKEEKVIEFDKPAKIEKTKKEEEVIVMPSEEKTTKPKKLEKESERIFEYSGKNYQLKKVDQGLGLFQENAQEPIAILIETNSGESYIYNSLTNQGVAYFDDAGNLIVEYFSRSENKKVSILYNLAD
ncbi:hypothetical protein [Christiangramia sp. SM2212]|uniref:Uncharacterized protein n=1 Tax=Christiangramia sediminicola TaxID=3073267 RepID=A0ABU1ETN7_9FLAO|nr:hypothetical protein [Christiangramia sp. SM2212]MDR5591742.1 hypothetical protein [Christiangramia sp. SM2212]